MWPGLWNNGAGSGESFIYAGRDINKCDLIPATRERAFAGQCYVLSANNILRKDQIPDDFPFKNSMTYAGPGQGEFVGWACGGSHIVAPTSEYMIEPTLDTETILYADLQAKPIKVVKSVFEALGHYARWDLVNLSALPAPYEPVATRPRLLTELETVPEPIIGRMSETVAEEFHLDPAKVDEVIHRILGAPA